MCNLKKSYHSNWLYQTISVFVLKWISCVDNKFKFLCSLIVLSSYQLSLALEPHDDSPSPCHSAPPSLLNLPPATIRQTLTHLFTSKATIVGDVLSSKGLSLSPTSTAKHTLGKSVYFNRYLSTRGNYDITNCESHEKRKRRNSLPPSIEQKSSVGTDKDSVIGNETLIPPHHGHVIKVAMTTSDHCNYNCLLVIRLYTDSYIHVQ